MAFTPSFCPFSTCPSRTADHPFTWKRHGSYRRKCDGRSIQRFTCLSCRHDFSAQTFRFDYRWKKPRLHFRVFELLVSKVTLRQMARVLRVRRPTIERRLHRIGPHCQDLHRGLLHRTRRRGGLRGIFQLDELETY